MRYSYDRRAAAPLTTEDKKAFNWLFDQRARAIVESMSALGKRLKAIDKEFEKHFPKVNRGLVEQHLSEVDAQNDHGFWRQVEPYYSTDESMYWTVEEPEKF